MVFGPAASDNNQETSHPGTAAEEKPIITVDLDKVTVAGVQPFMPRKRLRKVSEMVEVVFECP